MSEAKGPLGRMLMLRYGSANLFLALAAFPIAVHLPTFFSKYHGISFAMVGAIIALSRLTDVITDPVIGMWSDRTRSRFGRRKPFILAGLPLFMISIWFLFVPPQGAVSEAYVLVWIVLLYLGYTMCDLPYKAWGAELSDDYEERSRVTAFRELFQLGGLILALVIPLLVSVFGTDIDPERAQPHWMKAIAITTIIGMPILYLIALRTVPEPPIKQIEKVQRTWLASMRIVTGNNAFMRTLGSTALLVVGGTMTATLGISMVTDVLGLSEASYPLIILAYYLGSTVTIPVWLKLADKFGKHRAIALSVLWLGLWSAPIPFLPSDMVWMFMVCMIMKGTTVGALGLLPPSMGADVVDHDTVESGEQRAGLFFSLWGMVYKLSIAVGVVLGTLIPSQFGFAPGSAENTETALFVVAFCYSFGPAFLTFLAIPLIWNFPITKQVQQALRAQIEARAAS